jgi:hypothetical protein
MNQVEIKVTVDANNAEQMSAAVEFLKVLGNLKSVEPSQTSEAPTKKKEPAKAAVLKPAKEASEPEVKEQLKQESKEVAQEISIKVEDVRALLAKKVNDHRSEIKTKLTELGAGNVTSLKVEQYPDFMEFLNGLS